MDQKLKNFAISLLRKGTFKWKPRSNVKKAARRKQDKNPATGRLCWYSECAICHDLFLEKEIVMDHVLPVVCPKLGWQGFDVYIERMYPLEESGFQAICESCHDIKTLSENSERTVIKQSKKVKKKRIKK